MSSFKHKTNMGPGYHTQVFVLARQTYHQLTCLRVCVAQAALAPPAQPQELSVDVTTPLAVLADLVLCEIGLVWFEHIHCSLQVFSCHWRPCSASLGTCLDFVCKVFPVLENFPSQVGWIAAHP